MCCIGIISITTSDINLLNIFLIEKIISFNKFVQMTENTSNKHDTNIYRSEINRYNKFKKSTQINNIDTPTYLLSR